MFELEYIKFSLNISFIKINKMSFEGRVVLITGASSGIGADAARHLAKQGANLAIVGRNEQRLNQVADQIKNAGSSAPLVIVADVTKDTERIVNETISHFGKLNVLVNNAGIGLRDNICEMKMSDLDTLFDTNVRSIIILTKLCIPHLEKTKGNVVNVSSIAGLKSLPQHLSYGITKAALDQFTRSCALDLAPKGIRVNSINPAVIRTPIFERAGIPDDDINNMYERLKTIYPVGRPGDVSDTSAAIAFLADDKMASFLTGLLLPVDGGAMVAGVAF